MPGLEALLRPGSVAVIGASDDPARIGGRPLHYLISGGFEGAIHAVNPRRGTVQGLRAWPEIAAVPGDVDCAVLAIAAEAVPQAVRDCAAKGVRSLVVFSAGFAEAGEEGRRQQAAIAALAREHGMRMLGPNCLGLISEQARAYLTFTGVVGDIAGKGGRIGLVSQSGGYGSHVVRLAQQRGIAFGSWITTGNEADVELGEVMRHLAVDAGTDVVVAYIEGIRSRDSFLTALEAARRNRKPVVVMKVGRTAQGAHAAASHTASLAGSDAIYDVVLREHGAHRAHTTDELLDIVHAASRRLMVRGSRLLVLSGSGGVGVQAADYADEFALPLPEVPDTAAAAVRALVPNASARNPVDVTGNVINAPDLYGRSLAALLGSGAFDMAYVFIGLAGSSPALARPMLEGMAAALRQHPDTPVSVTILGPPALLAAYEAAGFLVHADAHPAFRALSALARMAEAWDRAPRPAPPPAPAALRLTEGGRLDEVAAKAVLARAGIALPDERAAATAEEAGALAAAFGGLRVALKLISPDLLHKSDVGGVALGLAPGDVADAAREMARHVAAAAPAARQAGFLVTPMIEAGIECIIGVHRDPVFGPVIMLGLGGVFVEVLRDTVCRVVPVDGTTARGMVAALRGAALLRGHRGSPPADVEALIEAILAVSALAGANADRIRTIEINPLRLMPAGQGAIALDAVIETEAR